MSADYMTPTRAEAELDEYEMKLPDCPPWPDATCARCGDVLSLHQAADPDAQPSLGDAACVGDMGAAFWEKRPPEQFELADGQSLDCPRRTVCEVCDIDICSEHSDQFVTCAGSWTVLHHWACRASCADCHDAALDDVKTRGL
jgi:hypothetical protein